MSNTSKVAQHLINMTDISSGIGNRVYNMLSFKYQHSDKEINKYIAYLGEYFPKQPDWLAKEKGHDLVRVKANEIAQPLEDFYFSFVDLCNWNETAWAMLNELSNNVTEFKLSVNPDLTHYFLTLLSRYIQLQMLMGRVVNQDCKGYITIYAKVHQTVKGQSEGSYTRICKYIDEFSVAPMKKIQEDCQQVVSKAVGTTLLSFFPILGGHTMLMQYSKHSTLEMLDKTPELLLHKGEDAFISMSYLGSIREWVLWGFMACPSELERPCAMETFQLALKETHVVTLWRNEKMNIHKFLEPMWYEYKNPPGKTKFKLKVHTKILTDCFDDYEASMQRHVDLRRYLTVELQTLLSLVRTQPALLCTRTQAILSLMKLAKEEVIYYYIHHGESAFKGTGIFGGANETPLDIQKDANVSQVIYLIYELKEEFTRNRRMVHDYYKHLTLTQDVGKLRQEIDSFAKAANVGTGLFRLLEETMSNVSGEEQEQYEAFRSDLFKLSMALSYASSGIKLATAAPLVAHLNSMLRRSRFIDALGLLLNEHGSFAQLFFYPAILNSEFTACLKATQGNAVYAFSYLPIVNDGLLNIHRACPEEQMEFGKLAIEKADGMLRQLIGQADALLMQIIKGRYASRMEYGARAVVARMGQKEAGALPGLESHPVSRAAIQQLTLYSRTVVDLLKKMALCEKINVHTYELCPREYIVEYLQHHLRASLRRLVGGGDGMLQRPSVVLSALKDVLYSYSVLDRQCCLGLSDIVRTVMQTELGGFYPKAGGELVAAPVVSADGKHCDMKIPELHAPCLVNIIKGYVSFFEKDLGQHNIHFNGVLKMFESRSHTPRAMSGDLYTDQGEMRALVLLLGPQGVEKLDTHLLNLFVNHVGVVHKTLSANIHVLNPIRGGKITNLQTWQQASAGLQGAPQLILSSAQAGAILEFRQMLRFAQGCVAEQFVPTIKANVVSAHAQATFFFSELFDPRIESLQKAAMASGVTGSMGADNDVLLFQVLRKFKTTSQDQQLWALLPELYAMALVSAAAQQSTRFLVVHEAYENNAHLLLNTVRDLILIFGSMDVDPNKMAVKTAETVKGEMERFVSLLSYSILNINATSETETAPRDLTLLIDFFVKSTHGRIKQSFLEGCYPYTMLRCAYVQLFDKQVPKNYHVEEMKE